MAKEELKAILFFAFIASSTQFNVFWNVPTFLCHKYDVNFDVDQYNIIQNTDDKWHGDKITIFYNPGAFPYYDENLMPINGGLPQNADYDAHIQKFETEIQKKIPDPSFSGIAVLDFEEYEPNYLTTRQLYKTESINWANGDKALAEKSFNDDSAALFKGLIEYGRQQRPGATWGYYHMPYCRNRIDYSACGDRQVEANTLMVDVYDAMEHLFPSHYLKQSIPVEFRKIRSQTRIEEAIRIKGLSQTPKFIYSYVRLNYADSVDEFLTEEDLNANIGSALELNTDGVILWGSSFDLNTHEKCAAFKNYVDQQLGPYIIQLTTVSAVF